MSKVNKGHVFFMIIIDDYPNELTLDQVNDITSFRCFNPASPKNKTLICDFCKVFYNMMRVFQDRNRGHIYCSHEAVEEPRTFMFLVENLKNFKNVRKIYILSVQSIDEGESPSIVANQIEHQKVKFFEFENIINKEEFKGKILYEILMTT